MSQEILKAELFLKPRDRELVKAAIREAEKASSGEIRVHLDDLIADSVLDHAAYVFTELGMHITQERNGVLFYVSVIDRKIAVIGDTGINEKVGEDYWADVVTVVRNNFKEGRHAEGLVEGIKLCGQKLSLHFPHQRDDKNELSDDISVG